MDLKLQNDVELCWGTPVFSLRWPDSDPLNANLRDLILERKSSTRGLTRSNQGGWHSKEDLLSWPSPDIQTLQDRIVEAFRRATSRTSKGQGYNGKAQITAWANVNLAGDLNETHTHPFCAWSGVYYVDTGLEAADTGEGGMIHFADPRGGAGMVPDYFGVFGTCRAIRPENGLMVLFPSWLGHGVRPHDGAHERISVAFNITLLDLI